MHHHATVQATNVSHRVLPISDPLVVELKAAKKRQASEKLTLGAAYSDLGYVVCNEAGQPYHPDTLSKMWANAVVVAGVPRGVHDANVCAFAARGAGRRCAEFGASCDNP